LPPDGGCVLGVKVRGVLFELSNRLRLPDAPPNGCAPDDLFEFCFPWSAANDRVLLLPLSPDRNLGSLLELRPPENFGSD
jgi:hypothetical protein